MYGMRRCWWCWWWWRRLRFCQTNIWCLFRLFPPPPSFVRNQHFTNHPVTVMMIMMMVMMVMMMMMMIGDVTGVGDNCCVCGNYVGFGFTICPNIPQIIWSWLKISGNHYCPHISSLINHVSMHISPLKLWWFLFFYFKQNILNIDSSHVCSLSKLFFICFSLFLWYNVR